MLSRFIFLLKYTLFWIVLFAFARALFLFYNYPLTVNLTVWEIALSFVHGFRLDMSITGYFMMAIGLMVVASTFVKPSIIKYPIHLLSVVFILFVTIVTVIDMELYRNWGFRMDSTPLSFLATPKQAMASTPTLLILTLFAVIIGLVTLAFAVYLKKIATLIVGFSPIKWYHSVLLLLLTALFFIPVRGTITVAPINAGTVYFSNKQYANHAAINVTWNFGDALTRIKKRKIDLNLMPNEVANSVTHKLFAQPDSTTYLLNTLKPNVLIIVLESFSADAINSFGGIDNITPSLNKLKNQGVAFTNIYASASRSDKGLISILSGYPSQLGTSVMNFPNKTRNLPSLAKTLKQRHYKSCFYYGGDSNFGNIRSYMLNVGFDKIDDMFTLPNEFDRSSKWGIHDHLMFNYLASDIDKSDEGFFKVFFTLSSHEPFEVPNYKAIPGTDSKSMALNSMHYTDNALGKFIETAKTKKWWSNTLVVLIADHCGRFPYEREIHVPNRYAIPMLWLGGALVTTGIEVNCIGSQNDLAATVLAQLNISDSAFAYSNNLLAKNAQSFASYTWPNGIGFISNSGQIAYDLKANTTVFATGDTTNLELKAKAFLQVYTNDFNNKELK